jgi:hypothetical protein|tara:strand:- start:64 stop:327 length:264 start_codon:yes stop_codon:yes gene_type:complete
MHQCWYIGVIVVTEDDTPEAAMEKFKDGKFLPENGFDLYKLPGTLPEVIEQIKQERPLDGLPNVEKDAQFSPDEGDETSKDNQPLPS